jgi:hypothetical protein
MGRFFIILLLISFINSCSFDPPDAKLKELKGNYYVAFESHAINDGLKIVYTEDNQIFEDISSNCIDIYQDENFIFFSKTLFEGDTTNYEYFEININKKKEPKKIDKAYFDNRVSSLNKINFSP